MKKYYFLLFLSLWSLSFLKASHIVGGDIQLNHLTAFDFELRLNLYYDRVNATFVVENTEPVILLHIFSKRTNRVIAEDIVLRLKQQSDIQYTNPSCTDGQLKTRLLIYENVIRLSPDIYNDPEGYYVVWERCCRNNVINNINDPGGVGMVFYLEFPAVVQGNTAFINSTPLFKAPIGDYLCLNEEFDFDFGANDKDGDSLTYSFTNPWAGNSEPNFPGNVDPNTLQGGVPPIPAPYALVNWLNVDGFQFNAQQALPTDLSQNQGFTINQRTGLIRVTPNRTGLFVFAVLCEEFRNGKKIGEVRRDFQFYVLDCPSNESPSVQVQQNELSTNQRGGIFYEQGDTLFMDQAQGFVCTKIWLKDPNMFETLRLKVIGINFQAPQSLLSVSQGVVNGSSDSLAVDFCWPSCLFSTQDNQGNLQPFVMDLVVSDNRCPRPANDTIRLTVVSIPIDNTPPIIGSNTLVDSKAEFDYTLEKIVGESFDFDVFAQDLIDNDVLELKAVGRGFDLAELGMSFENKTGVGSLESRFIWNTNCDLVIEEKNQYIIDFITTDDGQCEDKSKVLSVELIINDIAFEDEEFLPANIFTPNGDLINETFSLENVPEETCRYQFQNIEIFTRWGSKVFESFDKNFEWDGGNLPVGVYFYRINFKNKIYKGTVSLVK
ncbi:MAG: gliding motility-associated C-terminal domain-containing protein [Microscillaceae bacterium]|nr:gliding motility-associated C-terminal domain-containing protein [Microscillaceae bacterium]